VWVAVRLLGPLEVQCAGLPVAISAAKERLVLVLLALNAGRVVPVERLVDTVWGEDPPESATLTVRVLVSRLRKTLGAAGYPEVIRTRSPGYVLAADMVDVDVHRFQALAADGSARLAAGSADTAAAALRAALEVWHGDQLAESDGTRLAGEAARLTEARLAVLEARIDADLACGRHTELVSELEELCRRHRLRERLWSQRMLALYRCGRQADALAAYQQLHTTLADELGLDPSDQLRRLESAILTQDPTLHASGAPQPPTPSPAAADRTADPAPRQLPSPPRAFTGREPELAHLDAVLADAGTQSPAVVISALSGTAGVGKTALAVQWAHRVANRFPDGQLYVNLRGYDPTGIVLDPAEALRGFLDAVAVPPDRIPANLNAQAALFRSLLADKRMLVMLDNARDAEQVRSLLPGASGCLVLVTSRNQLSGLVTGEGAHPVTLDLLTAEEARELLARRLGASRVAAEPQAVDDIVACCARLPLALALVAARAATHPGFSLDVLAKELHETRGGLDAFADGEDATTDIRAVFSWSYQRLSTDAARLFRLLGPHPGPDISAAVAASLTGLPPARVRPLLAALTHAHLIVEHLPRRYTLHDLLRAYATEQALAHDSDTDRHDAIRRMLDHYVQGSVAADRQLWPDLPPPVLPAHQETLWTPVPATPDPLLTGRPAAQAWLDAERVNLVAASGYAAEHNWPEHSMDLARVLLRYLDAGGHHADAITLHTHARDASRRSGDQIAEAYVLFGLGLAFFRQGEFGRAAEHLQQTLTLGRRLDNPAAEIGTLTMLGSIFLRWGELGPAGEHLRLALTLSQRHGYRAKEAMALTFLGGVLFRRSELPPAAEYLQQALTLSRQVGQLHTEATALTFLGAVIRRRGELAAAAEHLQQALTLSQEIGDRSVEALALTFLGGVFLRGGELAAAAEHLHQALTLTHEIGDRTTEAAALALLGGVLLRGGELAAAAEHLQQALTLSRQVGDRVTEAVALTFVGTICRRRGELPLAEEHLQQALGLSRQFGDGATEAAVLTALGYLCAQQGEPQAAVEHLQHALTLCRRLGTRATEVDAFIGLGDVLHMIGCPQESRTQHTHALAVAAEIGDRDGQARAHEGMAVAYETAGDLGQARRHWQHALTLYARLDLPDADRVRARTGDPHLAFPTPT